MTSLTGYKIGTQAGGAGGATDLQSLSTKVRYPKTSYQLYADVIDLDDSTQRGVGLPTVVWHWTSITQAERDKLRTFCVGNTASVFIRTRTNDASAEFKYYSATMVWPSLGENYDTVTRQDFSIKFRNLVVQADP